MLCWSHIPHCWKSHTLAHMATIRYGYSKGDVMYAATNYVISIANIFESDPPCSDRWLYWFMKRYGDLQVAKPRKLAIIRTKAS